MSEQKKAAHTIGVVEQSKEKIITKFGNTTVVMTKDSIMATVQ
jgi:hypothetical protein